MKKVLVYAKHTPTARCGVAYFSAEMAKQFGGTLVHSYQGFSKCDEFYVNLDVFEMDEAEVRSLHNFISSGHAAKTILVMHDYRSSYVEDELVKVADVVLNLSGEAALNDIAPQKTLQLFTPSLIEAPVLELTKAAQHPLTLSFGFFNARKKIFKQYVAFYEYMVQQYPDWYHIIAASAHTGDTASDSQLLAQMINSDRVIVTDFMPNQILSELIHAADLGVFFYPTGIMVNNASPMAFFAAGKSVITTHGALTPTEYKQFTLDGNDFTKIDFTNLAAFKTIGTAAQQYYQTKLSWPVFAKLVTEYVGK
ncbi:MAG: hypothetical protein HY565_05695 [Candidatus Kerfeldbacteria bacterium]|nr:hypothetical protein [Candidatus Kerfeldbacteria bacterium]